MRTVAVVLAGGSGQRFGGERPKQLHVLAGRTLLEHSVAAFVQAPDIDAITIVMPTDLAGQAGQQFAGGNGYHKVTAVQYGVYRAADGICERALFVIDKNGTIAWSYCSPIGVNPGADGILQALEELPK